MKLQTLVVLSSIAWCPLMGATAATSSPTVTGPTVSDEEARNTMARYMDEVRNRNFTAGRRDEMRKLSKSVKYREALAYIRNRDPRVQETALAFIISTAIDGETAQLRSQAVEKFLRTQEANLPYDQLEPLLEVRSSNFSATSQRLLYKLFLRGTNRNNNRANRAYIRLLGLAQVQEAKSELQRLAASLEVDTNPQEVSERSVNLINSWWALSSLGDDVAADKLIAHIKAQTDEYERGYLIRDFASTRNRKVIKALMSYVFSDFVMPADDDIAGFSRAFSTAEELFKIVEGFPIPSYSEDSPNAYLQVARKWIQEHRDDFRIKL